MARRRYRAVHTPATPATAPNQALDPRRALDFKTWTDFVSHCDTAPSTGGEHDERASRREVLSRYDFTKTLNFQEAVNLATGGWPEGTAKAQALSHKIESQLYHIIQQANVVYDVTGELLDVARFCAGEPEHWGNWDYTLKEGEGTKYVHIVLSGFVSCGVDSDSLIARGVAVASLVNMLELAGCRAKITVAFALRGHHSSDRANITVPLKAYDEVLDLDRVTFALAHPAMFRRMIFSAMETFPLDIAKSIGAFDYYSSPGGIVADQGDLYIPEMSSEDRQWRTPESSVAWILANLRAQGVLVRETVA